MIKKLIIAIVVIIAVIAAVIFFYRYQILQYSAETIIRNILPDYVKIDKIDFRPQANSLVLSGFKISNPPGFSSSYLLDIEEVVCNYKMKGKNMLDGIEILEPVFRKATLQIERLSSGALNLMKMQAVLEKGSGLKPRNLPASENRSVKQGYNGMVGNKKISDMIKLPEAFLLKDSKIIFVDRLNRSNPYMITFENINSTVTLKLDELYSKVFMLASSGEGNLNGDRSEIVSWNLIWNPAAPNLTMSNNFVVTNLNIVTLEPYYDKYSPLVFKDGKFSGTLIFDFDNGSIGSTNEIHLSDFKFYIKPGFENALFWDTTVPDLVKYFSSPHGEIVFDFKIKGDISNPQFYLGPISKQALTSMAVDKLSAVIEKAGGPKSDMGKAKEYIEMFKGILKK